MKKLLFIVSFFCLSFDAAAFYSGLNFVPDSEYESLPKAELYRAYLPPRVDLSSQMPPVGSQGTVGACVGWSLVYSIRSYYAQTSFSPSFMYDNLVEGDCNKGLSFPLALSFLRDVGAVRISDYPIKVDNCSPNSNSSLLVPSAVNFKIKNWKTIKPSQIESIKGSLYRGNPVAVGMIIGSDFHLYTGGIYKNTQVSEPSGGHAMVIVGYDDRIKAFKLMNSWGPTWGEDGFGWISYDVLKSKAKELYIIGTDNLVPQPKPQPKPQPQPQPKPQHVEKIVTQQDVDDLIYEINNSVECSKIIGQLTGKKLPMDGVGQKTDAL